MNRLFTDNNPETTLKGLGFKNINKTKESIIKIEKYFNKLCKKQKLNHWTSYKTRPKEFITTNKQKIKYFQKQKMYRILGLLNRAKTIYLQYPNPELKQSILLLKKWMKNYKQKK
jgi:hypothetical protein